MNYAVCEILLCVSCKCRHAALWWFDRCPCVKNVLLRMICRLMIDGGSKDWAKVPGSPPEMITMIIIFVMITSIIIAIKTTIDYIV